MIQKSGNISTLLANSILFIFNDSHWPTSALNGHVSLFSLLTLLQIPSRFFPCLRLPFRGSLGIRECTLTPTTRTYASLPLLDSPPQPAAARSLFVNELIVSVFLWLFFFVLFFSGFFLSSSHANVDLCLNPWLETTHPYLSFLPPIL